MKAMGLRALYGLLVSLLVSFIATLVELI